MAASAALGPAWNSGRRDGDRAGGAGSLVVPGALALSGAVARSGLPARSGAAARSGPAERAGPVASSGRITSAEDGGGTESSIDGPERLLGAATGAGARSVAGCVSGASLP